MSWTFVNAPPARCELKAVIPHPVRDPLATSGLATRAPAFARLVAPREIGPPRDLAAPPEQSLDATVIAAPPSTDLAARPEPASTQGVDGPEITRDAPALPQRAADESPILLSAETAPLPLRDRAGQASRQ
jgi:hypothetical protein